MAHHTIKIAPGDTVTIVSEELESKKVNEAHLIKLMSVFKEFKILFEDIGLNHEKFFGKTRKLEYVFARIYMSHLLRNKYNLSEKEMVRLFKRDRTTFIHYKKQHENLIKQNFYEYMFLIETIQNKLLSYEENQTQN